MPGNRTKSSGLAIAAQRISSGLVVEGYVSVKSKYPTMVFLTFAELIAQIFSQRNVSLFIALWASNNTSYYASSGQGLYDFAVGSEAVIALGLTGL